MNAILIACYTSHLIYDYKVSIQLDYFGVKSIFPETAISLLESFLSDSPPQLP